MGEIARQISGTPVSQYTLREFLNEKKPLYSGLPSDYGYLKSIKVSFSSLAGKLVVAEGEGIIYAVDGRTIIQENDRDGRLYLTPAVQFYNSSGYFTVQDSTGELDAVRIYDFS